MKKFQKVIKKIPIRLHIGSEVFYSAEILNLIDDPLATIGINKYMLIANFHPQIIPNNHREIFLN